MQKIALLFPGQGAQYIGMGKDLCENFPEAEEVFKSAESIVQTDIRKIVYYGPDSELKRTRYAQLAIFLTSIAAFEVFKKRIFDSSKQVIVGSAGLSLGEATALTAARVFSLEDGIRFVQDRGLFMDEASIESPGSMAAIMNLELPVVEEICGNTGAEIGNLNAPGQIVISGKKDCVEAATVLCKERGAKRCIPLDVSGAFHSSCMNSACDRIQKALGDIELNRPDFAVISNLNAQSCDNPDQIKQNLVNQMNHRTLWEESMRNMVQDGVEVFFELGPGKVLKGLMRKIDSNVLVHSLGTYEEFLAIEKGEKCS